ncbi:MAG: VWA domain-containing protein [Acidobacteria bacterium]|nr:MAG: VWA domain-containing protein [Acidobacteriota bacterium]
MRRRTVRQKNVRYGSGRTVMLAAIAVSVVAVGMVVQLAMAAQDQGQAGAPTSGQIGYQNLSQGYTLKVSTNEVLVDVRVTDRRGNPVTNFKQSDFKVYEDGVPQEINSFDLENIQKLVEETGENGKPTEINLGALPKTTPQETYRRLVQNHRLVVLFFDLSSMQIPDLLRALKSAQNFLKTDMTPADLVALVTYSSDLKVLQDFTNNRDVLSKAIRSIQIGQSFTLASSGSVGEAGGTDSFGTEVVTQDTGNAFTPDETEFNIFNTDEKLSALQSLANLLQAVPGRKSVIHFSSGIEQTGVDNEAQLQATIDAANRANVSFYTLDARGLMAMPSGGGASAASPSGTAIYTASAVSSQINSTHNSRETLSTLATDTGGRMFTDLNNFAPVFEYVQKANTSYYLIGYTPSNTKADGKFRRIRVEVVEGRGLKVEARPGYYAPVSFGRSSGQQKELQLADALNSEAPFLDLPLAIETAYFLQPDHHYYVVLAAKIPGSSIPFRQHSSDHRTQFDFAWRATDSQGKVAGALRDTLPVKLDAYTFQTVLKGNLLYEGGLVLPPGTYKLKVVARENLTGKMGTFEKQLVLPPVSKTGLALSSVVVSNELSKKPPTRPQRGPWTTGAEDNPLDSGSQAILPSVTRVFYANQNLYVYFQSYVAKSASSGKSPRGSSPSPPSMALIFFRNGVQISQAGPYAAKSGKSGEGTASYFTEIPLAKFPPGRYWMQVNVMDVPANQVAFARIPMAIVSAPDKGGNHTGSSRDEKYAGPGTSGN